MKLWGKSFGVAISSLLSLEWLSLYAFDDPVASGGISAAIALAVGIATLRNTAWGVYAVLTELLVGGKGYLLSLPLGGGMNLSLRMLLFIIVLSVWLGRRLFGPRGLRETTPTGWLPWPAVVLAAAVALGIVHGLLRYPFNQVFFDANAWLFFLLLPVFADALKTPADWQGLPPLVAAAAVVLTVKTLAVLYLFGHADPTLLGPLYRWIRDTGVGEITYVAGTLWRVFFQSHLYALVSCLVSLQLLVSRQLHRRCDVATAAAVVYLSSLTVLVSQSRSLWVGGLVGLALILGLAVTRRQLSWPKALTVALLLAVVLQSQLSAVALVSGQVGGNVIAARLAGLEAEPASSSRTSQLVPLISAIGQHPLLGSGFGRQVTYQSQDPRVLKQHPDGWYTTAAFEWGYLDIALKIGLLGVAVYLAWMAHLVFTALRLSEPSTERNALLPSLAVGLTGIAAVNIFSPYLNHPLGIGFVMLTAAAVTAARRRNIEMS